MQPSAIQRALAAAMSIASALGLPVDDVVVLHDSNKLTARLLPCDIVARVAPIAQQVAQFEVELARRLAEAQSPVAALDPRAEPRVYERDGFVVTLWTYYQPVTPREVSAADYANALERLHAGMRQLDVRTPHFTDRVEEAQRLVGSSNLTPDLADADRGLLITTLRSRRQAIIDRGAAEQLLHGEPHSPMVTTRTFGPAGRSRPPAGSPMAAALAGVSGTSSSNPSIAISRQSRRNAPRVSSPATGPADRDAGLVGVLGRFVEHPDVGRDHPGPAAAGC